jgi:hypothetical protein
MNETATAQLLKSIGISSNMILIITAIGVGFYIYRNYYETVKLRYQIQALKQSVSIDPKLM